LVIAGYKAEFLVLNMVLYIHRFAHIYRQFVSYMSADFSLLPCANNCNTFFPPNLSTLFFHRGLINTAMCYKMLPNTDDVICPNNAFYTFFIFLCHLKTSTIKFKFPYFLSVYFIWYTNFPFRRRVVLCNIFFNVFGYIYYFDKNSLNSCCRFTFKHIANTFHNYKLLIAKFKSFIFI
jgi:hypothetical protein